jgi:tetratricopeptide (TPR) repeat protein
MSNLIGDDDEFSYRVNLGLGSSHFARALLNDDAIDKITDRLESQYLSGEHRVRLASALVEQQAQRQQHLEDAETALRKVLADEFQRDNVYAYIDLVLVLNAMGGRDDEVMESGHRAIELLEGSNKIWRRIQQNPNRSPSAKIEGQLKIDNNLAKERLLRDLLATVEFNRGEIEAYLEEIEFMEARQLMTEAQYFNRGNVYADLGEIGKAIADIETFLRMRARYLEYEDDKLAPMAFRRLDELRMQLARTSSR